MLNLFIVRYNETRIPSWTLLPCLDICFSKLYIFPTPHFPWIFLSSFNLQHSLSDDKGWNPLLKIARLCWCFQTALPIYMGNLNLRKFWYRFFREWLHCFTFFFAESFKWICQIITDHWLFELVNIEKRHGFKRRLKTEKIFHVLEDLFIYGKNRMHCRGTGRTLSSLAKEAERRKISNKSVCEERGVSYNAFSVFVDAGGNTRDTISRI